LPDIFLSYSSEDLAIARRFAEGFVREGFSVWWDATLNPGDAFDQAIEKALGEAKAVVVLWSKHSVASRWVRAEATQANENHTLVPVMIEACKRPIIFELTHTADLSHWTGDPNDKAWQSYLAGLRRFVDKAGPTQTAIPVTGGSDRRQRFSATSLAVLTAVVLLAGGILWAITRKSSEHGLTQNSESAPKAISQAYALPASAPVGVSLAVLPFVNMSADPQQEYFSDGLSEELLNQLAQNKELRVAGRTSSFSFKGKNEDLRVIGEKLGVNHLLEGSVRKDGKQLRITAQLINAADGTHLWSQTYDRELSGIFALQEEIAKDVSQALSITLDVGEMSRAKGGTTNVDAYDKYLRARTLFNQLGPKELLQSTQLYREALALDPKFTRAWSGLYEALTFTLSWIPENFTAEVREMTEVSAHIVALAPDAWWTQSMRAGQFEQQRKWSEAEAAASAALASAPASESSVLISYGFFQIDVGRTREAVEYLRRAREIDPLSLGTSGLLQLSLDCAGLPAEAQAEYERSKNFAGDHAIWDWWAVQRLWSRKDAAPADVEAQFRVLLKHESLPMALSQIIVKRLNNKEAAVTAIREAFKDPTNQDPTRIGVVGEYADHFGDKDTALAAMRRALVELHGIDFIGLWQPNETGLRSDPRFKDVLHELGLVDYFRKSGTWGDFCKPVGKDDFECH
jgi:TolB-like protein